MSRVDDGQVRLGRQPSTLHVQLAWAVAALTPDGVALEDWRLVAVQRPGHCAELVGVAEQAVGLDRALEVWACAELAVAGRDIPAPLAGQTTRSATGKGNHRARSRRRYRASPIRERTGLQPRSRQTTFPSASRRAALWNTRPSRCSIVYRTPLCSIGSPARAPAGGPSSMPVDRRERSAHRVRAVGQGDLAMAPGYRPHPRRMRPPVARSQTASRRPRPARARAWPKSSAGGPRSPAAIARLARRSRPRATPRSRRQPGVKGRVGVRRGGLRSFTAHSRGCSVSEVAASS